MPSHWKRPDGQLTDREISDLTGSRRKAPVPEAAPRVTQRRGRPATADCYYYEDAEREFMCALDRWKRVSGHWHPDDGEVLGVLLGLGYVRDRPPDVAEFTDALASYRREHKRPFMTCCEVLQVLISLDYRKGAGDAPVLPQLREIEG